MSKISSISLYKVPPRWVFLKLETDDGLIGWGEPVLEGRAETVMAAVKELEEYLINKDPNLIEDIFQVLYRGGFYRGGPILTSAISGIEQALWDIKGKRLGVPVYDLLGGAVRDKMEVYAWVGGDQPNDVVQAALERKAHGYRAIKMNGVPAMEWIETPSKVKSIVSLVQEVRAAVGWEIQIALDFHGRVRKPMAKQLFKELEFIKPMFIEEPLLPCNLDQLEQIAFYSPIPIATGERLFTRWDFKELLIKGIVDIIQPDISHAGGIWELRKIAAMAEIFDVAIAPHCPLGPIAFAASLQLDFCTPNALIQETSMGIHYNSETYDLAYYLKNPEVVMPVDGFVPLLKGPGLGIEIDEEKVIEAAKVGHNWKNPVWRGKDGSFIEW